MAIKESVMKNMKNKVYLLALYASAPAFAGEFDLDLLGDYRQAGSSSSSSSSRMPVVTQKTVASSSSGNRMFIPAQKQEPELLYENALALNKANRKTEALQTLKQAAEAHTNSIPGYIAKIKAAEAVKEYYQKGQEQDPESVKVYSFKIVKCYDELFLLAQLQKEDTTTFAQILLDIIKDGKYKNLSGTRYSLDLEPKHKKWLASKEKLYRAQLAKEAARGKGKAKEIWDKEALDLASQALIILGNAEQENDVTKRLSLKNEALQLLLQASKRTNHSLYNVEYNLAKLYYENGNLDLAKKYIDYAIPLAPEHLKTQALELSGALKNESYAIRVREIRENKSQRSQKDIEDEVFLILKDATLKTDKNFYVESELAKIYFNKEEYALAIGHAQKALRLSGDEFEKAILEGLMSQAQKNAIIKSRKNIASTQSYERVTSRLAGHEPERKPAKTSASSSQANLEPEQEQEEEEKKEKTLFQRLFGTGKVQAKRTGE